MANRNVDLIIRAKDNASRAFTAVSTALDDLLKTQKTVADGAGRMDAALTGSQGTAAALARQFGTAFTRQFEAAAIAFQRIETTLNASRSAYEQQRADLEKSRVAYKDLQTQIRGAEVAIVSAAIKARESGGLADAERLDAAQKAYKGLVREAAKVAPTLDAQDAALTQAATELKRVETAGLAAAVALREVERQRLRAAGVAANQPTAVANESARRGIAFLAEAEKRIALEIRARQAATAQADAEYRKANENAAKGIGELARRERLLEVQIRARQNAQANKAAGIGFGVLGDQEAAAARASDLRTAAAQASARALALLEARYRSMQAAARPTIADQENLGTAFRRAADNAEAQRGSISRGLRELLNIGPAATGAARGLNQAAAGAANLKRSLAAFYGDSRRALSLMQRLRGEVLSLTASFVGFYGAFQQGAGVVQSFQSVEAATSRLGALFDGNRTEVRDELARLTKEADRLGISFNVLSANYSKFAISGKQAGIELKTINTIFRQVAEAGRVLKLSNDDIEGILTALTQIAGKGTLQMEELRQQLGDRLPGAVGLVSEALGYTSDNLDQFYADVTNGTVAAEEALVALGNGLEKAYGGQLQGALTNVSAQIGQLQNLFFQRQLTAANSGFIAAIEEALAALNAFLASDEGIQFFEKLGAVMGDVVGLVPSVVENFDLLLVLFKGFVAIKLAQVFTGLIGSFARTAGGSVALRQTILALNSTIYAFSPAALAAVASATRLGAALRGLRAVAASVAVGIRAVFLSLGGPIGIAVAAASYFAIDGLGKVDEAASAVNKTLEKHQSVLAEVKTAYGDASAAAAGWVKNLRPGAVIEITARLTELKTQLQEYRTSTANTISGQRGKNPEVRARLSALANTPAEAALIRRVLQSEEAFSQARMSARDYLKELEAIQEAAPNLIPIKVLENLREAAAGGLALEEAVREAEAALALISGTATDADKAILGIETSGEAATEQTKDLTEKVKDASDALDKLAGSVPALQDELERLDAVGKLAKDFEDALTAARALPDAIMRVAAEQKALQTFNLGMDGITAGSLPGDFASASTGAQAAGSLLRQFEGFRSTPYYDVNAYRVGYGSDTITLADGTIQKVTQGIAVSVADAQRDLLRRIKTEFLPKARGQVGAAQFDALNPQQQGALTSIAYNYGSLPRSIVAAVKTGSTEGVASAIRALGSDNNGINRNRRNSEAAIFSQGIGNDEAVKRALKAEEDIAEAAAKRAEEQRNFREEQAATIAQTEFETSLERARLVDQEVAKALREAEIAAKQVGLELTKQERDAIESSVRAKFASKQAEEDKNAELEKGRQLQEAVTQLEERRDFLRSQAEFQQSSGDTAGLAATESELASVNAALDEAVAKALAFWQALGGPDSATAITALQNTQLEIAKAGDTSITTGEQLNRSFAQIGAAAVDRFAQRVAAGENAVTAFKEEFLRAAGQFLIQIGQMILQQALFNAISGGSGAGANPNGGGGGFLAGLVNGIFRHGGGLVNGSGRSGRSFDPAMFANAARYHGGGIAGLGANEIPAVLQRDEEILTRSDPRHMLNGGKSPGSGGKSSTKIINAFDGSDMLEQALASSDGEDVILNFLRSRSDKVRAVLE